MHHQGAIMCITTDNVDALVLIGDKKTPCIVESTIRKIKELDHPISDAISFSGVQPVFIAANVVNVSGRLGGDEKVMFCFEKLILKCQFSQR